MQFEGIYAPVITPYREDGHIDREAFVAQIEALIDAGVHGIVNGGSTGEYYAQSMAERVELATLAQQVVAGRVPLVVGTVAIRLEDALLMAETAARIGASALLVGSPPYAMPTEAENAMNALAIDRAADLPIMLYNYPGRMGVDMGPAFLDHLADHPNFCAIKESSGDIERLHLLACDHPHIQLACGMDDQALEFFAWGARSWVCAGANFLPEAHIALWRACVVDGDFAKGRRIMSAMLPLLRLLEQGGKFIQCVKHGCGLKGRRAGPPRPPLQALSADEAQRLAQVLDELERNLSAIDAS